MKTIVMILLVMYWMFIITGHVTAKELSRTEFNVNYKFMVDTEYNKKKKLMNIFRLVRLVTTGIK